MSVHHDISHISKYMSKLQALQAHEQTSLKFWVMVNLICFLKKAYFCVFSMFAIVIVLNIPVTWKQK